MSEPVAQETDPTAEPAVEPTPEPGTPTPEPEDGEEEAGDEEEVPLEEPATGEPSAASEQVLSEKQMRAALDKLDREKERHTARVSEIMGEDALSLVPCELCAPNIPGFRFNMAPSEETQTAVRKVLGMPTVENLKPDPYSRRCDVCDGKGKTRTDSLVERQETVRCIPCEGRGWIAVGAERQTGAASPVAAQPVNGPEPVLDDGIKRDMFGTPETDPDYGLMPQLRARPITYWQEHAS
jgi:hypothetical protein